MKDLFVFKYNIWYDGDALEHRQERYVVAYDEAESEEKLLKYRQWLVDNHYATFHYAYIGVEIQGVII